MLVAWRNTATATHWEDPCACKQSWHQGPLHPISSGEGTLFPVPSQRLQSSHIAGNSPGKLCRLLLFLPSNNIFPAQNNIGKVSGLLVLFQARLPLLPQPRQIPPGSSGYTGSRPFLFPGFTSPGNSTLPCPIRHRYPFTPGWGSYRSHPSIRGVSLGRDSGKLEGHWAVLQCSQSTQQQNAPSPLTQATGSRSKRKRVALSERESWGCAAPTAQHLPLSPSPVNTQQSEAQLGTSSFSSPRFSFQRLPTALIAIFFFCPPGRRRWQNLFHGKTVSVSNLEEEQNNQLKKEIKTASKGYLLPAGGCGALGAPRT